MAKIPWTISYYNFPELQDFTGKELKLVYDKMKRISLDGESPMQINEFCARVINDAIDNKKMGLHVVTGEVINETPIQKAVKKLLKADSSNRLAEQIKSSHKHLLKGADPLKSPMYLSAMVRNDSTITRQFIEQSKQFLHTK